MSGRALGDPIFSLWVYLSATPLLWLTVTMIVYLAADRLSIATGRHPLANPVLHAIWIVALILRVTGTPYGVYFEGAQFVHFLLGPATVALAIPLYQNRRTVLAALAPMAAALMVGGVVALVAAVGFAKLAGLPPTVIVSLAPKSVTAGVAMGISDALGGDAPLTAVLVILTGVIGAVIVTPLMTLCRVTDWRARGFAAGLASHGIGTAHAFQTHPLAGAFAGVAMGLNALFTAVLAPIALSLL